MKRTLLLVVLLFGLFSIGRADLLVGFEFNGYAGSEARGTSTVENANIQVTYIERGSGISAAANANRFNGTSWTIGGGESDAVTSNDYFTWTLNAKAGATFSVTNIVFNWDRSSTGPSNAFLRTSNDGFSSTIASWDVSGASNYIADLSGAALTNLTSLEFRLYGYRAGGSAGSGGFEGSGNDLVLNGTAIPEPGTLALFGSALAGLLILRRRWRI